MKCYFSLILLALSLHGFSQQKLVTYTFEKVDSVYSQSPRPIFVFLEADWCRICGQMKATTLSDSTVVAALNRGFYFVPFDGESREEVTYQNVTYTFQPTGVGTGTNELATALGQVDGKVNYPTLCILRNQTDIVFKHGGALSKNELLNILQKVIEQ
jgi:thioredoxin-related protein